MTFIFLEIFFKLHTNSFMRSFASSIRSIRLIDYVLLLRGISVLAQSPVGTLGVRQTVERSRVLGLPNAIWWRVYGARLFTFADFFLWLLHRLRDGDEELRAQCDEPHRELTHSPCFVSARKQRAGVIRTRSVHLLVKRLAFFCCRNYFTSS